MRKKLTKVGTSTGVIIPFSILELLGVNPRENGYTVDISLKDGGLFLSDFRKDEDKNDIGL